jgi:hypothetical protein
MTKSTTTKTPRTKHFYVALLGNLLVGVVLAFLTGDTLRFMHAASRSELFGWLSFSASGSAISFGLIAWLLLVFLADFLWVIFFSLWLLKHALHIEDNDNTLYLP